MSHWKTEYLSRIKGLRSKITYQIRKESTVEDEISSSVINDRSVNLLMAIPGMGIYSSEVIMGEIDDVSIFGSKEKSS